MTPVVLLVGFCATMTAIAVGRLVVNDRTPVDVGTALVVLGITLLSALWVALEEAWMSTMGRLLLAITGVGGVAVGLLMISKYWGTAAGDEQTER